jgi:5-methylcytosine-specific restriction endonuclease McrA
VSRTLPKSPRLQLDPESYERLAAAGLARCQSCGFISNLEVHHKEFRSRGGDDSEQNLITRARRPIVSRRLPGTPEASRI